MYVYTTPSIPTHGCLQSNIMLEQSPVPEAYSLMDFLKYFKLLNKCQAVIHLYLFFEGLYIQNDK